VLDAVHQLGLGVFLWADVIIGGVDNREARLWMNRVAWKLRKPWIDGAIEGINGIARVFVPGQPPCYECTLGETDWALLERRMSCNLLVRDANPAGKVPTTPTISSIIAGVEVQEAVKLAHGLPVLAGKGLVFEGLNHTSYVVEYTENPDCQSHYTLPLILQIDRHSDEITLHELWQHASTQIGGEVTLEFSRDVISRLVCPSCKKNEEEIIFAPVGSVDYERGFCPADGKMRVVETIHSYSGKEWYGMRKLSQLGLPVFDIYTARCDGREIGFLIAGDRDEVLSEFTAEVNS
jgi:adenylyltransferase/sulfurtransferase